MNVDLPSMIGNFSVGGVPIFTVLVILAIIFAVGYITLKIRKPEYLNLLHERSIMNSSSGNKNIFEITRQIILFALPRSIGFSQIKPLYILIVIVFVFANYTVLAIIFSIISYDSFGIYISSVYSDSPAFSPLILAGIISPLLIRGLIRWLSGSRIILRSFVDLLLLSVIVPILGFGMSFVTTIPVTIISSTLLISELASIDVIVYVSFFTGFGIISAVSVIMMKNPFPMEAEIMTEIFSELNKMDQEISKMKNQLNKSNHIQALRLYKNVRQKFNNIKYSENSFQYISNRATDIEGRLDKLGVRIIDEILSEDSVHMTVDQYIEVNELLTQIEQTEDQSGSAINSVNTLREHINKNISDIVESKTEEIRGFLDRAEEAKREDNYEIAHEYLDKGLKTKNKIDDLGDTHTDDSYNRVVDELSNLRSEVNAAEKQARIETHKQQIATDIGIDESLVNLDSNDPNLYQELGQTIGTVKKLKQDYNSRPWNNIENDIIESFPGISNNQVQTYSQIISNSEQILGYIETVGESHPSIHAIQWREAVDTALVEIEIDPLESITSDIDRLKGGLWQREHLYQMSWQEFEQLVGSLYDSMGCKVEVTQGTSDMGIDVWAQKNGKRRAIQVKQFSPGNIVGREPLQKTVSSIAKGDADEAVVVTSSQFTRTAEEYANDFGSGLELISGDDLIEMLTESDIPPPISKNEEPNSKSNTNQRGKSEKSSNQIGSPTKNWNNYNKYSYDRFNDATDDIKELKRKRKHDKAEELLLWCINFAEAETKPNQRGHPRWYYKHLAIIYRKEDRYDDEVSILQRYVSFCESMNIEPREEITDRLEKAKQLVAE